MAAKTKEKPVDSLGTGRRKSSVARVRVREGSGNITINKRTLEEYFHNEEQRNAVLAPLNRVNRLSDVDIIIRAHGGGISGQAGACSLGIARALRAYDGELEAELREGDLLTRDSRMKERKKPGLRGARRGAQFSKR